MIWALAAVLLAGCLDEQAIAITIGVESTTVTIVDASCDCLAPRAGCRDYSDVGPAVSSCECALERPCGDALFSLTRDGATVSALETASWSGDFRGGRLYVSGCGRKALIDLPVELPAPPANLAIEGGTLRFEPPRGTEWSTVGPAAPGFAGTVCTVPGTATTLEDPRIRAPFVVTSTQRVPHSVTEIGAVWLTVTSSQVSLP